MSKRLNTTEFVLDENEHFNYISVNINQSTVHVPTNVYEQCTRPIISIYITKIALCLNRSFLSVVHSVHRRLRISCNCVQITSRAIITYLKYKIWSALCAAEVHDPVQ